MMTDPRDQKLLDALADHKRSVEEMWLIQKTMKFAYDARKEASTAGVIELEELEIASILLELNADGDTVAALILSRIIVDCGVSLVEIENSFGRDVCMIAQSIIRLGQVKPQLKKPIESCELLLAIAEDARSTRCQAPKTSVLCLAKDEDETGVCQRANKFPGSSNNNWELQ